MKKAKPYQRLSEFEPYINLKANQFARNPSDKEDFAQEGRIAALEALRIDPTATKSYVQQRIDWYMIMYSQRVVYKNPEEISADEHFSGILWGHFSSEE